MLLHSVLWKTGRVRGQLTVSTRVQAGVWRGGRAFGRLLTCAEWGQGIPRQGGGLVHEWRRRLGFGTVSHLRGIPEASSQLRKACNVPWDRRALSPDSFL